jgi:hypothetical protein
MADFGALHSFDDPFTHWIADDFIDAEEETGVGAASKGCGAEEAPGGRIPRACLRCAWARNVAGGGLAGTAMRGRVNRLIFDRSVCYVLCGGDPPQRYLQYPKQILEMPMIRSVVAKAIRAHRREQRQ